MTVRLCKWRTSENTGLTRHNIAEYFYLQLHFYLQMCTFKPTVAYLHPFCISNNGKSEMTSILKNSRVLELLHTVQASFGLTQPPNKPIRRAIQGSKYAEM
jgi:hypothetical protein